jgi:putative transposase
MALGRGLIRRESIVHTDRGSQYVAAAYRSLLAESGWRQSMSAKGNCDEKAQAASFFSRFKAELVEDGIFEDVRQAKSETFSKATTIGRWRHASLGDKSPPRV